MGALEVTGVGRSPLGCPSPIALYTETLLWGCQQRRLLEPPGCGEEALTWWGSELS